MIITCPQCTTQYRYNEARFGGAERKRLKCPKCTHVFEVVNPELDELESTSSGKGGNAVTGRHATTDHHRVEPEAPELPALAPLPHELRFSLAVIAGTQAGTVFPVGKPRSYLGRGTTMDIQIQDSEVSRRHVMLEIRGEEATVVDMGSTNGTFVGGEQVDRAILANHEEFTLGSTTLMLIVTPTSETPL